MAESSALKFVIRGEDKSSAAFRSVKKSITALATSVFSLKGLLVGALGLAGLGAVTKTILDTGDKLHKLSARLKISTDSLSQLQHAASLSGVSLETMTMSLQRMTRRVSEAAIGTGSAKKAIEELGLDAVKLSEMSPEKAFQLIADALMNVEKHSDKVRIAMAVFGMQGAEMLQMMTEGGKGIQDMMKRADELGFTLNQAGAEDIAAFNDSMTDLKAIFYGLAQDLAITLLPHIEDLISAFTQWWRINGDIIKMHFSNVIWDLREAFDRILPKVMAAVATFQQWWQTAKTVYDWLGKLNERLKTIMSYAFGAATGTGIGTMLSQATGTGAFALAPSAEPETAASGETDQWGEKASTNVIINQQLSRSDVTAIINETSRRQGRI